MFVQHQMTLRPSTVCLLYVDFLRYFLFYILVYNGFVQII